MDTATAYLVSELGKLAIQGFFSLAALSGKSVEEIEAMFQEEKAKFLERDPADLPPPPE